jgi:hypothetical protein
MTGTVDRRGSNDRLRVRAGARRFGVKGLCVALGLACVPVLAACRSPSNLRYFDIWEINPHRELKAFFSIVPGRLLDYTMTPDPAFHGGSGGGRS